MTYNRNRIGPITYRLLRRAHQSLAAAPADAHVRARFRAWCKAAGRCLGLRAPLTAVEIDGVELRR